MKQNISKIDVYGTGQNIKRLMQQRGLTVRDIQVYLGLAAPQGIYHWFDGRNLPTVDNLYALSELFQEPVDTMLCGNRRIQFHFCGHPACERAYVYCEKYAELMAG